MPSFERQSYAWFAARARNALRRRMAASIVASIVFVAALIGLVLIPRQASRTVRAAEIRTANRPDTAPVLAARTQALRQRARADSALVRARALAAQAAAIIAGDGKPALLDTLPVELHPERDSLTSLLDELHAAMRRAEASPLPPAFRALAQTRALRDNARVRRLLDSLDQIDKLREPFGALGAGDPIYVALTAHVNELGRSIRDAAQLKRSELRARVAPLLPIPAPPSVLEARADTAPVLAARSEAQRRYVIATQALQQMREQNEIIDADLARARNLANLGAPPIAMLAAALVLGLVTAFIWTFVRELQYPRLAHQREAEAVAGMRVLTTIRSIELVDRSRRQTDLDTPPLIDLVSERYRTLYLHLAATGATVPTVTVTGDLAAIFTTVASNLAALAAYEARSTLLIDADSKINDVASIFRIAPNPGLAGLIRGESDWSRSITTVTVGRDRPLDVLPTGTSLGKPSGEFSGESSLSHGVDRVREDLIRMEHRYDFVVIAVSAAYVGEVANTIIPTQDVILCAQLGQTRIADLRAMIRDLEEVGRNIHGLVLWDDDIPHIEHYHG